MTRLPQASFDEALDAFLFFSTWPGLELPVRLAGWPDDERIWRRFGAAGGAGDLPGIVRYLDEEHDDEIQLGAPWTTRAAGGVSQAAMLWCRVTGPDQLGRANRFRPRPSMVLVEGKSQRLCLWWLEDVLGWVELKAANRKLAYALRAVQKHGDPDELVFCAPGTCIRDGRARPMPVRVARLTHATFRAETLVGRLKTPPEIVWNGAAARN